MENYLAVRLLLLVAATTLFQTAVDCKELQALRRQKREWIIPPRRLKENERYTHQVIAKIRSDKEVRNNIMYSLEGYGANLEPVNLFTVDTATGDVRVNGILDREVTAFYSLLGVAKFPDGTRAEKDIDLRIIVVDDNDCAPVFQTVSAGSVEECSEAGTLVMQIEATDADEPGTPHSQIAYSIMEQSPGGDMFYINQATGEVFVSKSTLDREKYESYTLTVRGTDLNGAAGGNSGTGQVVIKLQDVNDNIPYLENEFYECSVIENVANVEILRFKVIDLDLIHTDNWLAVFTIVSGNEAGYFNIITDSETNEGILMVNKALNYEELKQLNLQVTVANKASYHSSVVITEAKPYTIKVSVKNEPEGPQFRPLVKVVSISEDRTSIDFKKVIAGYAAIDSDTLLIATNVRYAKLEDKDNWLIIDENTGDIRLNKLPDRESKYLINGTYYAKIIAITTDIPAKTATGTVAIQVEDFNDHCPTLTSTTQTVCYEDNVVYVRAEDSDEFPNGAPFDFRVLTQNAQEEWTVERLNDTTIILRAKKELWPGTYKVALDIKDQQGKACTDEQVLQLTVCTCGTAKVCLSRPERGPKSIFGTAGILLLLLGLLLLLLIPLLLLFCECGGAAGLPDFKTIPCDTKEHLIAYNSEGRGDVPLLEFPREIENPLVKADDVGAVGAAQLTEADQFMSGDMAAEATSSFFHRNGHHGYHRPTGRHEVDYVPGAAFTGDEGFYSRFEGMGAYEGIALSEAFLGNYYSQKASRTAESEAQRDNLLVYEHEISESPAGLDDCCSFIHEDNDLSFLDDLGPKFKTLAEICRGSALETVDSRVTSVPVPIPVPAPVPAPTPTPAPAASITNVNIGAESSGSAAPAMASSLSSTTVVTETGHREMASASSSHMLVHENVSVPGHAIFIQQPPVYYTAPPVYVVDPQAQPAMLVSGAVVGMQENVVLMEKGGPEVVRVAQHTATLPRLSQGHGLVLVEQKTGGSTGADGQAMLGLTPESLSQAALSQGTLSGSRSMKITETTRVQSWEPKGGVQRTEGKSLLTERQVLSGPTA